MYNKSVIFKSAWKYIKENNDTKSIAFKKAWKEAKLNKVYKENIPTIKKVCWRYTIWFKLDFDILFSKANEIFLETYDKYNYGKIPFKKYLYIQLNNYLKMYCKKEILRKKQEEIVYHSNHTIEEIKIKEKQELSKLSKQILNYCLEQNTKNRVVYQKRKYKNKVYSYPVKIKNISIGSIKEYFKKQYKIIDIEEAFKEIRYVLKKELI
jgi:hypothetical protein